MLYIGCNVALSELGYILDRMWCNFDLSVYKLEGLCSNCPMVRSRFVVVWLCLSQGIF